MFSALTLGWSVFMLVLGKNAAVHDRVVSTVASTLPGLIEKKRGVFYRKSRAFLHFHEDPKGMFADLSDPEERIDVTGEAGQAALMAAARERLKA